MRCLLKFLLVPLVLIAVLLVVGAAGLAYANHRVVGQYFDSNGVRLHYTDEGHGEPVILVHGFAVNADLNFRHAGVTAALARSYRVIALDSRGHGLSEKPHDVAKYGVEMARDVARLMNHLKIAKAHIVSYSLGGYVALKFATLYPDKCITVTAGASGWNPSKTHGGLAHFHALGESLAPAYGVPLAGAKDAPPRMPLGQRIFARALTLLNNDGAALTASLLACEDLQITEEQLRALKMPILSVAGVRDPLGNDIEPMKGKVQDHTVCMVASDHYLTPTRSEFIGAIQAFLEKHHVAQ